MAPGGGRPFPAATSPILGPRSLGNSRSLPGGRADGSGRRTMTTGARVVEFPAVFPPMASGAGGLRLPPGGAAPGSRPGWVGDDRPPTPQGRSTRRTGSCSRPKMCPVVLAQSEEVIGIDHRVALLTAWPVGPASLPAGRRLGPTRAECSPAPRRPRDHGAHHRVESGSSVGGSSERCDGSISSRWSGGLYPPIRVRIPPRARDFSTGAS